MNRSFKSVFDRRIAKAVFPFILIVILSVVFQLSQSTAYTYYWQYNSVPLFLQVGVICGLLAVTGWRILGKSQRVAWIGLCVAMVLTFCQGALIRSFYGINQVGMLAVSENVGILFFCFLLLYLVRHLTVVQLDYYVRVGLIISGSVLFIVCLCQHFGVQVFLEKDLIVPIDASGLYSDAMRLVGTSGPAVTAGVLTLCWPAILGRHFARRSWRLQLLTGGGILLFLWALLLTYTRAAYLGLILQWIMLAAVLFRSHQQHIRLWIRRGVLVLIPAFCVMLILIPSIARRFAYLMQPTDASVGNRLHLYQSLISLLSERPLCGWGFGIFEFLYKAYDRIPGVSYSYGPAHSTILLYLFQMGLLGCLFFPVAVCGWSLLRSFVRIPLWMGVSMIGVFPILLTDNLTDVLVGFKFPLLLFLTLLVGYGRLYDRRYGCPRWFPWAVSAAVLCWMVAALQSPAEPIDRLNARLEQSARRMRGDVSVVVGDLAAERCWTYDAATSYSSILAGIATPVHAALMNNSDVECSLRGYQMAPGGAEVLGQSAKRSDLAALALSNPTQTTMNYLLQSVTDEQLKDSNRELFNEAHYSGAEWKLLCPTCAGFEVKNTYEPPATHLTDIATTATVEQILGAYCRLTDFESTGSKVARVGLSSFTDRSGLARHLVSCHGVLLGISAYTGSFREEVLLSRGDWEGWGIAARYNSHTAITPRVDTAANRMFAQMAWNVYCYYDMFTPDKSNASANAGYRPWFLRTGRTCWTTPFKY